MKDTERRSFEMLLRVRDFGATHADAFGRFLIDNLAPVTYLPRARIGRAVSLETA